MRSCSCTRVLAQPVVPVQCIVYSGFNGEREIYGGVAPTETVCTRRTLAAAASQLQGVLMLRLSLLSERVSRIHSHLL